MTYCHPLDCHTAPVSRSRHRARSAAKLFTLDREGAGATPLSHSGTVATEGKRSGWAQQPASGPRRGYGRTGASPRDGPGPFGDAGAKGTGTGPLGQPMRPQPRRCARERGKRCPSGAFAEGESDPNESSEASGGQKRQQCPPRRLSLRNRHRRARSAPSPAGPRPALGAGRA